MGWLSKFRGVLAAFLVGLALAIAPGFAFGGQSLVRGRWEVVCRGPDGSIKWVERFWNIVVTEGLNELLSVTLDAGSQSTTWYVGLKGTGTPNAADTMGSHASWSEITPYSDATRPQWNGGTVAAGSVDNSASKASFTANATATVYGAFLSSNSTKGGTTGKLYAVGNFSSTKDIASGDTLQVTATFTTADDGV